jgi:DNA polymerase III subunit beta
VEATGATGDLIVHPRALGQVQKLFKPDEEVEVAAPRTTSASAATDGADLHPADRGAVPELRAGHPQGQRQDDDRGQGALTAAIRRMAIVASDQTHRIRLSLGGPMMKFSVQTPDLGEAAEELPVEYEGEPLEIGFNANYLLELLRYMPTDEVKMTFKAPERAATMSRSATRTRPIPLPGDAAAAAGRARTGSPWPW